MPTVWFKLKWQTGSERGIKTIFAVLHEGDLRLRSGLLAKVFMSCLHAVCYIN